MHTLSLVNSVQITFVQYMQGFRLNAEIFLIDRSDSQFPGWGGGGGWGGGVEGNQAVAQEEATGCLSRVQRSAATAPQVDFPVPARLHSGLGGGDNSH
jgi:hypothetical protein